LLPSRIQFSRFKALVYAPQEAARNLGRRLSGRWSEALAQSRACSTIQDHWRFAEAQFQPCQKPWEIQEFLAWARTGKPRVVVEIGVARGGTSYLLMQCLPDMERYIGVDFFPRNVGQLRAFARPQLRIDYVRGASGAPKVVAQVEKLLGGRTIDLLFIDGDHSYAGVKRDWECYRRWVRPGGWIAFHDIREPELTPDGGYANGFEVAVNQLWAEIKPVAPTREFVAADHKPGYGIGVWQQIDEGTRGEAP
jgi:predicted O-methyltransferase YrrM